MADLISSFLGKVPIKLVETTYGVGNVIIASLAVFEADCVMSESYQKTSNVTNYPVEGGSTLSEHAMVNSSTISISGLVSDASMTFFSVASVVDSFAGSTLGGAFNLQSKSQKAYKLLNRWMDRAIPLDVRTHFQKNGYKTVGGSISPWIIESLSIPRDSRTGQCLRFDMTLRQITIVTVSSGTGLLKDLGTQNLSDNAKAASAAENNPAVGRQEAALRDRPEAAVNSMLSIGG